MNEEQANSANNISDAEIKYNSEEKQSGQSSVDNEQVWQILSYIFFLIPLLAVPDTKRSPVLRFHLNQGAILFIVAVVGHIILSLLPLNFVLSQIWSLAILVLLIIGIVNVVNRAQKPLPVIGHLFTIIK